MFQHFKKKLCAQSWLEKYPALRVCVHYDEIMVERLWLWRLFRAQKSRGKESRSFCSLRSHYKLPGKLRAKLEKFYSAVWFFMGSFTVNEKGPHIYLLSWITRKRRDFLHLSRIARSVTMERRSFVRTRLWRNNHIHDTLLAVYRKCRQPSTGCIFILDTVSIIDNKWNHSHGKENEFVMSTQNAWYILLHGLIRGIFTCPTDACNMVLAWAIYSGIPLICTMQYNIINFFLWFGTFQKTAHTHEQYHVKMRGS